MRCLNRRNLPYTHIKVTWHEPHTMSVNNRYPPVDANFATFANVYLSPLAIILVLTSELDVLELIKHLRHSCGGFGQHGLHRHSHNEVHMLLDLLQVFNN